MAMIERSPRVATVKAAIRTTVVKLPAEPFRELLKRKPELDKRMRSELGRLLDLGPALQRGCAFVEVFDRLFARFLRRGHGPVRSASGAGRNGSEFGAEPIAEGASGQGGPPLS